MKKTTLKTFAVICSVLFVTACSSGGGGEGPSTAATDTNNAVNTASTTTNTANVSSNTTNNSNTTDTTAGTNTSSTAANTSSDTSNKPSTQAATSGNTNTANISTDSNSKSGVAIIGQPRNAHNSPFSLVNSANLDSITIDGKQIALTNNGNVGTLFTEFQEINTSSAVVVQTTASGKRFSYMRFGGTVWGDGMTGERKSYDYVIGDITPTVGSNAVPTSGKASYSGLTLLSNIGGGGWIQGASKFDVDFGRKSINGLLDASSYKVELSGNISGASFSGEKNGIEMKGNFYGPQAAELGGVFKGSIIDGGVITNLNGSFGAKKQ